MDHHFQVHLCGHDGGHDAPGVRRSQRDPRCSTGCLRQICCQRQYGFFQGAGGDAEKEDARHYQHQAAEGDTSHGQLENQVLACCDIYQLGICTLRQVGQQAGCMVIRYVVQGVDLVEEKRPGPAGSLRPQWPRSLVAGPRSHNGLGPGCTRWPGSSRWYL